MREIIKVKNVSKVYKINKRKSGLFGAVLNLFAPRYEKKIAVSDMNFSIEEGEAVAFIGSNGAGKSTTIKMLSGILYPSEGEITVASYVPYKQRKKYVSNIGVVLGQKSQLVWDLPVRDGYELIRHIYKISKEDYEKRLDEFIEMLDMKEFINQPVRQLSLGQKMRAEIVATMLHNPKIIFLDEPTIGLDLVAKKKIQDFIRTINKKYNVTIIFTTHDMQDMSNGEMVEATKKEKIIQRMNYHDLVPYVKKTKMGILELDINFLFDGNKNLIDKNVYEMGTMVYKGRYRITGLNPYTNLAFLCCHFYREATDTIWTEGKRDVTLYKIVDMMNFIRFYREQINYDIMIEVLKKLNIEKKAYFTFKIMTEFYEYEFLSEMLSRLDEYKSGDDEMKAIHDTKNKTTIYRDETFFEKTFARG